MLLLLQTQRTSATYHVSPHGEPERKTRLQVTAEKMGSWSDANVYSVKESLAFLPPTETNTDGNTSVWWPG